MRGGPGFSAGGSAAPAPPEGPLPFGPYPVHSAGRSRRSAGSVHGGNEAGGVNRDEGLPLRLGRLPGLGGPPAESLSLPHPPPSDPSPWNHQGPWEEGQRCASARLAGVAGSIRDPSPRADRADARCRPRPEIPCPPPAPLRNRRRPAVSKASADCPPARCRGGPAAPFLRASRSPAESRRRPSAPAAPGCRALATAEHWAQWLLVVGGEGERARAD